MKLNKKALMPTITSQGPVSLERLHQFRLARGIMLLTSLFIRYQFVNMTFSKPLINFAANQHSWSMLVRKEMKR